VKPSAVAWALIAAMFLTSCGGCEVAKLFSFNFKKFTRERYDTIYHGQPREQVRKKLGEPHETTGNAWVYSHEEPFYTAVVFFEAGKVTAKRWSEMDRMDPRKAKEFRETYSGLPK
jgi:hypothetical protein